MFKHSLGVEVCDQEGDVETLGASQLAIVDQRGRGVKSQTTLTAIGFLLRIMKLSARPVMNLVNLWQRIFSISSACLMAMLTRTELMDGSIRTRSLSFREMVRGVRRTSFVELHPRGWRGSMVGGEEINGKYRRGEQGKNTSNSRSFHFRFIMSFNNLRINTHT